MIAIARYIMQHTRNGFAILNIVRIIAKSSGFVVVIVVVVIFSAKG